MHVRKGRQNLNNRYYTNEYSTREGLEVGGKWLLHTQQPSSNTVRDQGRKKKKKRKRYRKHTVKTGTMGGKSTRGRNDGLDVQRGRATQGHYRGKSSRNLETASSSLRRPDASAQSKQQNKTSVLVE